MQTSVPFPNTVQHGVKGSSGSITSVLERETRSVGFQVYRVYEHILLVSSFFYCKRHSLSATWCLLTFLLFFLCFLLYLYLLLFLRWLWRRVRVPLPDLVDCVTHRLCWTCKFVNMVFLGTECFDAMTSNGDVETAYDARNAFDSCTALDAWLRCRALCGRRNTVL